MELTSQQHDEYLISRQEGFSRLGFDAAHALMLAESRVDIHDAQELVRQDCPPDVAFDILREFEVG